MIVYTFRAAILLAACLFSGCVFYQRYPLAPGRFTKIDKSHLSFYLLDAAHPRTRAWYLSETDFRQDRVTAFLTKMDEPDAAEAFVVHNRRDARFSRDEVLLFARPRFVMALADTITLTIPYAELEKVEVYEVNAGKSVGVSLLTILTPIVLLGVLAEY